VGAAASQVAVYNTVFGLFDWSITHFFDNSKSKHKDVITLNNCWWWSKETSQFKVKGSSDTMEASLIYNASLPSLVL
jgi:hypothetical protein